MTSSETFRKFVEKGERAHAQCLILLRRYLTGDAKTALEGIGAADADYERAWDVLDKRYGDKEQLKHLLLDKIKEARKLREETDVKKLRKHHDYVSGLYTRLGDIWPNMAQHEEVLYNSFLGTYPRRTLEVAEANLPANNKDVKLLFEQVEARILQLDRHTTFLEGNKTNKESDKPKGGDYKKKGAGTTHNFHNAAGGAAAAAKRGGNGNGNGSKTKSGSRTRRQDQGSAQQTRWKRRWRR